MSERVNGDTPIQSRDQILQSTDWLRERLGQPTLGLILGSGLGGVGDQILDGESIPYSAIPHWPSSTAIGHAGNLLVGRIAGVQVAALQGRFHLYEGHTWESIAHMLTSLSACGTKGWVVSNAAGGVHPDFRCGDLMLLSGHLNLMSGGCQRQAVSKPGDAQRRQGSRLEPYASEWREDWKRLARSLDVRMHEGVYAGVTGPNYETRAEYRAFRRMGADAVGMSTVPEVCAIQSLDLPVLGVSVITNEARPDAPTKNDAQDVIEQAQRAERDLQEILERWIAQRFATTISD